MFSSTTEVTLCHKFPLLALDLSSCATLAQSLNYALWNTELELWSMHSASVEHTVRPSV